MRRLHSQFEALLTAALLVPSVAAVLCFPAAARAQSSDDYSDDERSHWSLQPRSRPLTPQVVDRAWAANPIDAFIRARLEQANLLPAPPADRRTLIRRAYFSLTALPPHPAEIAEFEGDACPAA